MEVDALRAEVTNFKQEICRKDENTTVMKGSDFVISRAVLHATGLPDKLA